MMTWPVRDGTGATLCLVSGVCFCVVVISFDVVVRMENFERMINKGDLESVLETKMQ